MGIIYKSGILYSAPGGGGGNADYIELTQIQYDALTPEEKMNGAIYLITDGGGSGNGSYTYYGTTDPPSTLGGNGDMYVIYDAINEVVTTMYIKITGIWMLFNVRSGGGIQRVTSNSTITVTGGTTE